MDAGPDEPSLPPLTTWALDGLVFGYAAALTTSFGVPLCTMRWPDLPSGHELEEFVHDWMELGASVPFLCLAAAVAGGRVLAMCWREPRAAGATSFAAAVLVAWGITALQWAAHPWPRWYGLPERSAGPSWFAAGLAAFPVWSIYLRRVTSGRPGTTVATVGGVWAGVVVAVVFAASFR